MSKNKENKLVPKLRFPEFKNKENWESMQIGSILNAESSSLALNKLELKQSGYAVYGADSIIGYIDTFQHKHPYISIVKDGSGVGRLNLCEGETSTLGTLSALKSKDEKKYHIEWAYYLLNTIDFSSYVKGSGIPHIYYSDYKSQNIGVPKPDEQQKIAACLSSLDEVITAESQKLEMLKDHKKGLLQNLLPQAGETVPKFRFKEFEDSGEWEETTLMQVASFVNNKTQLENLSINSYISTENLLPDYAGVALASKLPSSGNFTKYQKGDILVSNIRPYLKKVWFADKEGACSNDVIVIRATSFVSSEFLSNLLRNDAFIGYIMKKVEGVKMPRGDKDSIREYPIVFPKNPKEQKKIADTLSSIDDLIIAQNQKLEALQLHKKGLLQGLFPSINNE